MDRGEGGEAAYVLARPVRPGKTGESLL